MKSQEYEDALSQERETCAALERRKGELEATLQHTTLEAESMTGTLTKELESVRTQLQQTKVLITQWCVGCLCGIYMELTSTILADNL